MRPRRGRRTITCMGRRSADRFEQRLLEDVLHMGTADPRKKNHWAVVLNQGLVWTPGDGTLVRVADIDDRWRKNLLTWLVRNADWLLDAAGEETRLAPEVWIQTKPIYRALLRAEIRRLRGKADDAS